MFFIIGEAKELFKRKFMNQIQLIISNEEMKDILKVVKSLEELRLLIKGISEQ